MIKKQGITYDGGVDQGLGMALGGLGTSTLEIGRDGALRGLRLQNAWETNDGDNPRCMVLLPQTPLGTFFSVHTRTQSGSACGRVLQLKAPGNLTGVNALKYTGRFPFVSLDYHDAGMPCDLSLEAFSPFIPRDADSSSLPVVFFSFQTKNTTAESMDMALACSWGNDIRAQYSRQGRPAIGNRNECLMVDGNPAVRMFTLDPSMAGSEYCLVGLSAAGVRWQSVSDWWPQQPGRWMARNIMVVGDEAAPLDAPLGAWQAFLERGELPPESKYDDGLERFSQHQPVGALAGGVTLAPGESREVTFALFWCFPWHYEECNRRYSADKTVLGHHYVTRFPGGTRDVAAWVLPRRDRLRERSLTWRRLIEESSLSPAVQGLIAETLYLLPRITWWTADDSFYILESIDCPRVTATILDRYTASALTSLFPELHAKLLQGVASAQLQSGEIPSTMGICGVHRHEYRVFNPGDASIFPLSIAWQALWHDDPAFISEMYPVLKKTLRWGLRELDGDGDGVPDVHGIDQGWDTFPMQGCASYIADQWMAALLAGAAVARLHKDTAFADWCDAARRKASETVENKLWNGAYYNLSVRHSDQSKSAICFVDQFTYGTVAARILKLGEVHPAERIRVALDTIWRMNVRPAKFVCRAGANPDGSPADCSHHKEQKGGHSQSNCFSPVMAVPLACAAIQHGLVDEGLALLEAMAEVIIHRLREPWSGKLLFDSQTGDWFYGIHYSDCLIVWDILFVLLGVQINAPERGLEFAPPRLPVKIPLFGSLFTGQVEITGTGMRLENASGRPCCLDRLVVRLPDGRLINKPRITSGAGRIMEGVAGCMAVAGVCMDPGAAWVAEWQSQESGETPSQKPGEKSKP